MRIVASPLAELAGKFEEKVAAFVKEQRVPGAAAGIVHGDDLVWSGGYGFADVATERPDDAQTLFRIASITKTFTGTAIMQLRDEGRLHLNDPAVTYLPELRGAVSPFGPIETVTIRRMLSHESGLMGDPPGARWFDDVYEASPAANLAHASHIATTIAPNVHQKYSNLAFQFLGEIVARVSGRAFAGVVQEGILDPLGMTSTAFPPLPEDLATRRATGYRPRWMSDEFTPAEGLSVFAQAEGGLWSCIVDLGRWISAQFLAEGASEGHRTVLADATLTEMQRPRYLEGDTWAEAWCIAWYAKRTGDTVWIQHSGGLPGFITNVCFHAKERVGAIVLLNGVAEASTLAMELGGMALEAARTAVVAPEVPPPMPPAYGDLLGIYGEPSEAILARLEWRDAKLRFVDPSEPTWSPVLLPTQDPDRFTVDLGERESGEPVEFHRAGDGRVSGVTIGPYSLRRFEPVES